MTHAFRQQINKLWRNNSIVESAVFSAKRLHRCPRNFTIYSSFAFYCGISLTSKTSLEARKKNLTFSQQYCGRA